jgi:hypothetical protein
MEIDKQKTYKACTGGKNATMDGIEIVSVLAGSLVLLGLFFLPIAYKNKGKGYRPRMKPTPVINS